MPTPRRKFRSYFERDELPAQQMTVDYFRANGFEVAEVERFIPTAGGGFKRDCFGFADLIVFKPDRRGSLAFIQATAKSCHAERYRKILAHARAYELVQLGYRVGLASWERTGTWSRKPYFKWFTGAMFEDLPIGFAYPWNPRGWKQRAHRNRAAAAMERLPVDAWAMWEAGQTREAGLFA